MGCWKHVNRFSYLLFKFLVNSLTLFLSCCGNIAGPTHVLVVRGLDETVDEESLHCEFSKYAPIKVLVKVMY